jgi:hypothetical protein
VCSWLIRGAGYVGYEYGPVWDLKMEPLVPLPWRHRTFILMAGLIGLSEMERSMMMEKRDRMNMARNS